MTNGGKNSGNSSVPGSTRAPVPGARNARPVPATESIEVTVRLRCASRSKAQVVYGKRGKAALTRAELAAAVGASAADARAVEQFAHNAGLTVVSVELARRTVMLRGLAPAMQAAFGITLQRVDSDLGTFRQRVGDVHVPAALKPVVTGVFGLDDRPQAKPHVRRATTPLSPFTPLAVGQDYQFPTGTDGTGQCIGIIELGGGYKTADLSTYFASLSLTPPTVIPIAVDGGQNAPTGSADGPDAEVMLDIEISGALAPKATLAVYFTPNTDQGFIDAVTTAVHDTTHAPTVISISWGGPESTWTAQALQALDEAIAEASAAGIAVCIAAGDDGATDGVSDGALHVDFPGSSPHALCCGGTRLVVTQGTATDTTWNDLSTGSGATGGGFSATFAAPTWQSAAIAPYKQTNRGVPDVSGDADPDTGYNVRVDGQAVTLGGTSAVAPLWAALIARCQQGSGRTLVDLAAQMYAAQSTAFRDVTQGGNGGYNAGPGWDPCTGLGVPIGTQVLSAVFGAGASTKTRVVKGKKPVVKKKTGPARRGKR
jgi:kumamolisin